MSNFITRLLPMAKKALINPTTAQLPGFRFIGGDLVPFKSDKLTYIEKGYTKNDLVYSIINLILEKAVQSPFAFYQVKDEQKYFQYRALCEKLSGSSPGHFTAKAFGTMRELRHKSIELLTSDSYLNDLIKWPNENECFSDHNKGLWGWKLITGDYFEAGWSPWSGGINAGKPMQLYGLPSQYMSILATNTLPIGEAGYLLSLGTQIPFATEDVLHEKYFNPEWDLQGNQLYGMAPLRASLMRVQRNSEVQLRGAKTAKNGGADVVAYLDNDKFLERDFKMAKAQMSRLKDTWDLEQGGNENAGKAIWSTYKVGATRLGLSPVEMDALNSEVVDLRFLCNTFGGVPSQLLNDSANSTYNNISEGEKALTTRCAFPLLTSRERSFNRKLQMMPAYKGKNIVGEFDRTVYTELEEDKVALTTWLDKSYLPLRRRYELLNEDIPAGMTDEELNAIPVPTGMTLLSELFVQPSSIQGDINALNAAGANPYNNA
jgi:hypothetical protein